jgi:uncharacterized membrane protein YhaH (DUF805 family)
MSLLSGRMSLRVFWVCYIGLVAAHAALMLSLGNRLAIDVILFAPWLLIASRRLRDLNAPWWWALAPATAGFVEGFARGWIQAAAEHRGEVQTHDAGQPTQQLARLADVDWGLVSQYPLDFARGFVSGFGQAVVAQATQHPFSFAVSGALLLVLFFWPGTRGRNRFGEPPRRATESAAPAQARSATRSE